MMNSRWLCRQTCLVNLGSLSCVGAARVTWVIGTTLRIGALQSGAISNSVLFCATQIRSPRLRALRRLGSIWCLPSSKQTPLFCVWLLVVPDLVVEASKGWLGFLSVVVAFLGVGWLAILRNNLMIAFFSFSSASLSHTLTRGTTWG